MVRLKSLQTESEESKALGLKILSTTKHQLTVINCSALVKPLGRLCSGDKVFVVDNEEVYHLNCE
jgi:hypothetical protein